MKKINEYDERQLKLMLKNLISFEMNQIELSSLVGSLEFLLNAMESVEKDWEERFLKEVTTLESINAIRMIKESGEDAPEIDTDRAKELIGNAVSKLKMLVASELNNE